MYNSKPNAIPITSIMLAIKSQRFANYTIDLIVHNVITVVPLAIAWLLYEFFGNEALTFGLEDSTQL